MSVTVYTKNHCQPCVATKRKLGELGVAFREINVEEDDAARQKLIDLGFRESPVVMVGGEDAWSGYRPDKLAELGK